MEGIAITSLLILIILGVIARRKRAYQKERNHYGNYVMMVDEDLEHFKDV